MTVRVATSDRAPADSTPLMRFCAQGADVEINVIDRLPTPFGLIRAGVALTIKKQKMSHAL